MEAPTWSLSTHWMAGEPRTSGRMACKLHSDGAPHPVNAQMSGRTCTRVLLLLQQSKSWTHLEHGQEGLLVALELAMLAHQAQQVVRPKLGLCD